MGAEESERRIVEARMKLRERWRARVLATRARSDPKPMGSGPTNRHGMPQLPPGQRRTDKWPVLGLGRQPQIGLDDWKLKPDGVCDHPLQLDWAGFRALEQVEDVSDFHCVTGWFKMDMGWRGVRVADLVALIGLREEATHVVCYGYDGYTTNLPLEEALKLDVLLAFEMDGQPLSREAVLLPASWEQSVGLLLLAGGCAELSVQPEQFSHSCPGRRAPAVTRWRPCEDSYVSLGLGRASSAIAQS